MCKSIIVQFKCTHKKTEDRPCIYLGTDKCKEEKENEKGKGDEKVDEYRPYNCGTCEDNERGIGGPHYKLSSEGGFGIPWSRDRE